jgi:glycolate oxidase
MVGSEGTLGVFSEITVKLIPKPESIATVLALFSNVQAAAFAVEKILCNGFLPRCLELVDETALVAMRANGFSINEHACAMLVVEVDGSLAACEEQMVKVGDSCEGNDCLELLVAQDNAQRDRLWGARRQLSPSIRKMSKYKLSEDVVVPRSKISKLLELVRVISDKSKVRCLAYGHAGDGNLHVNFLWDEPDEVPKVKVAIEMMLRDVVSLGGTISGEHGIGVLKRPFLALEQGPELISLQKRLKGIFDPQGILNPGKIFE